MVSTNRILFICAKNVCQYYRAVTRGLTNGEANVTGMLPAAGYEATVGVRRKSGQMPPYHSNFIHALMIMSNAFLIVLFAVVVIIVVLLVLIRNKKDREEMEQEFNEDYRKPKTSEGDVNVEEKV